MSVRARQVIIIEGLIGASRIELAPEEAKLLRGVLHGLLGPEDPPAPRKMLTAEEEEVLRDYATAARLGVRLSDVTDTLENHG